MQQCVKNVERGPAQDGDKQQKIENDSLKKECDCLKKVTGPPNQEPHFFFPSTESLGTKNESGTSALVGSYSYTKPAVSGVPNRKVLRAVLGVKTMHSWDNPREKLQNTEKGRGKPQECNFTSLFIADISFIGCILSGNLSPLLTEAVIKAVSG